MSTLNKSGLAIMIIGVWLVTVASVPPLTTWAALVSVLMEFCGGSMLTHESRGGQQ